MLGQYPWILPRERELERLAFDDFFLSQDMTPPAAQIETTSTVLMKSLVMQSDALTFIPRELIYWEALAGQLKALPVPGAQWARIMGMTRRRKGSVSPSGKRLMQIIKTCAQEHF